MDENPSAGSDGPGRAARRRILQIIGGIGILSTAGCLGDDDDESSDDDAGDDTDDDSDDAPSDPDDHGDDDEEDVVPGEDYEPPPSDEWPPRVNPGADGLAAEPPDDATILWDGETMTLDVWEHGDGSDAEWIEHEDYFEVNIGTGDIYPPVAMGDCHLHLEWGNPPEVAEVDGQASGNSGVFMMGTYEVQVLNNYDNPVDPGTEAGAFYPTDGTLHMPARPPGEWQEYDIIFRAPRFDDGELVRYPMATVFFNGVCVKAHFNIYGATGHPDPNPIEDFHPTEDDEYVEEAPFRLQDHGQEYDMVHYRNIWYRDLPERPVEPHEHPDEIPTYDTSTRGDEYPEMLEPGGLGTTGEPPADADVLFDSLLLEPGDGDYESSDSYGDAQIHVEWRVPEEAAALGPYRGNSGVLMLGEYEIQLLDTYDNPVEADEWAGAYTHQEPPHHDAVRESGEWQHLDVVWQGPRFDDGELDMPAQVTVLLNGVVVQTRLTVDGPNANGNVGTYEPHEEERPLRLQEPAEDNSEVRFQNGWIRSLR